MSNNILPPDVPAVVQDDPVRTTLLGILIDPDATNTSRISAARALVALRLRDEDRQAEITEEEAARTLALKEAYDLLDEFKDIVLENSSLRARLEKYEPLPDRNELLAESTAL